MGIGLQVAAIGSGHGPCEAAIQRRVPCGTMDRLRWSLDVAGFLKVMIGRKLGLVADLGNSLGLKRRSAEDPPLASLVT